LYGDANETLYWVRPLDMFIEQVDVEGQLLPRFSLVAPDA